MSTIIVCDSCGSIQEDNNFALINRSKDTHLCPECFAKYEEILKELDDSHYDAVEGLNIIFGV